MLFTIDCNNCFDVLCELTPVSAKWHNIGIALRVNADFLEGIHKRGGDPTSCLTSVVEEWLRKNYNEKRFGEPTWQWLVEAVGHPAGGANMAQAREIAKRHKAKERVSTTTSEKIIEEHKTGSMSSVYTL